MNNNNPRARTRHLADILKEYMEKNNLNAYKMGRLAGISEATVRNIVGGYSRGSIPALKKIAGVMGIPQTVLTQSRRTRRAYYPHEIIKKAKAKKEGRELYKSKPHGAKAKRKRKKRTTTSTTSAPESKSSGNDVEFIVELYQKLSKTKQRSLRLELVDLVYGK